jgi:hypothetical protein
MTELTAVATIKTGQFDRANCMSTDVMSPSNLQGYPARKVFKKMQGLLIKFRKKVGQVYLCFFSSSHQTDNLSLLKFE